MSTWVKDISISISCLDRLEKYYEGTEYGSILKDHVTCLKNGLDFLAKHFLLEIDECLYDHVKDLANYVKRMLSKSRFRKAYTKRFYAYEDLLGMMRGLVNLPLSDYISFYRFEENIQSTDTYMRIIDFLLKNISDVLNRNTNDTADYQTAALVKKLGEMRTAIIYYKPLYRCLAHLLSLHYRSTYFPLVDVLNEAAVAVYFLLVCKLDEKFVVLSLERILEFEKLWMNSNIYLKFLKNISPQFPSEEKGQFYILDNLIHILAMNLDSLNDANIHLYVELRELRTLVGNETRRDERLDHYLGLTASTESICYQAEPIVYSCYMEEDELEEDLNEILTSVICQIKMIKQDHGSKEIKLYVYPRVDCLGFLEFFLEHLKESNLHDQVSVISGQIEALHTDINCLVSSPKITQDMLASEGVWTHIVRLVYEAEYVIDLCIVIPHPRCISTLSNIVEEVKEIKEKLLALPDISHVPVEDFATATSRHDHGMPLEVDNAFIGFQEDIDAIKKYILEGEHDLQTISVVGMAGAGKTSLAKYLFKESSVVGHFDKKAWCTASQSYQRKDLLLTILNQINPFDSDNSKIDNDQELADKLCRTLKRRRYLMVIDDVWDVSLWNYLKRYFPNDETKSRILITTRDHNVVSETKSNIHKLGALTEDESWELLQKKLPQQEFLPENLASIAKDVARNCKGLPLSIVVIGGLMHNVERNEDSWNEIAKDVTSTILSEPQGQCDYILELSYNNLPNHLQSCFLYLGVFPEDHEISVTRLVRLWIAEGLVREAIMSRESAEDVGKRYVDDLVTRSLVIPVKEKTEGGVKILQLHDLLRDFCLKRSIKEHYFTVLDDRGVFDLSICPRRISINPGMVKHLPFISLNGVRTMISICKTNEYHASEIERIMEAEHMMLLNVLDIRELMHLASNVYRFIHLRYLAIWRIYSSDQVIVQSSICKLCNLQVLILSFYYYQAFEVPDSIWDLVKLRHIRLLPCALFPRHDSKRVEDSPGLLENLKSLSKPRLHYGDSNWLCKLTNLQKLSCIFYYSQDDILFQRYRFPELSLCNWLTSLNVKNDAKGYEKDRGKLHLPESLRKLSLSNFILDSDDISEIGKSVPNLEVLKLNDSFKSWNTNDEDFPKLKVLKISGMSCQEWDASEDSFPSLEQLLLGSCDSLEGIPLSFGDILCLRLISVKYCNSAVYESAREIQRMQAEAQNLELKLIIAKFDEY